MPASSFVIQIRLETGSSENWNKHCHKYLVMLSTLSAHAVRKGDAYVSAAIQITQLIFFGGWGVGWGGDSYFPHCKDQKTETWSHRSHKASKSRLEPGSSDSKALALYRSPCWGVCLPSPENSDCHVWCGIHNHTVKHVVLDGCPWSPSPTQNTLISFVTVAPNQMSGAWRRSTHRDISEDRKGKILIEVNHGSLSNITWTHAIMVNFICQFGKTVGPRYII